VLRILLPASGADIERHLRSQQELLAESGYSVQSNNFHSLLRILDGELRLITPTDPDLDDMLTDAELDEYLASLDSNSVRASSSKDAKNKQYYRLTHAYLVPCLRLWLARKQT
jgi:eukaryotic-like serine/threonine-protein kinase